MTWKQKPKAAQSHSPHKAASLRRGFLPLSLGGLLYLAGSRRVVALSKAVSGACPTFSIFVAASLTRDTSLLRHAFAEVSPCVQAAFPRPPQHLTITKLCNSIQLAPTKHHACQMFIKRSLAGMYCLQAVRAYVPSTGKQKRSRN